eukprot:918144-Pelagomonas_calceolata.AAC.6
MVLDLWASSGEEMVRLAALSRFSTYTNFCFSMEAIMQARPLGSHVRNWPGTKRLHPDLP